MLFSSYSLGLTSINSAWLLMPLLPEPQCGFMVLGFQLTHHKQKLWFIHSHGAIEMSQRNWRSKEGPFLIVIICSCFWFVFQHPPAYSGDIKSESHGPIRVSQVDPVVHLDIASFETTFKSHGFPSHQIKGEQRIINLVYYLGKKIVLA